MKKKKKIPNSPYPRSSAKIKTKLGDSLVFSFGEHENKKDKRMIKINDLFPIMLK